MAGEQAPDVTASPVTAETSTPDYSTQPAQLTPPAAPVEPTPAGPASAPASAAGPTPGVHGVLGSIVVGALEGAAKKMATGVGNRLKNFAQNSPYGQELQKNAQQREAAAQEMQLKQNQESRAQQTAGQEAQKSVDAHTEAVIRTNGMTADNMHKVIENQHIEELYPGEEEIQRNTLRTQHLAQNAADRDLLSTLEASGVHIDVGHGAGHDSLTQDHARDVALGKTTMISNGQTGKDAGYGVLDNMELQNTPLSADAKVVSDWNLDPKTGKMTPVYKTLTAGHNTAFDALIAHDAASKKFQTLQDQYSKQLADSKVKAETFKATEEGEKAESEAKLASGQVLEHTAQQLVDANEDPSQLTKRSKTYDAQVAAADDYSMKTYGVHWSPAQASIDFKYAQALATQNTLRYLNSLTGKDGKSGNLQQLVNMSNSINRTDFPALNDKIAWAKLQLGHPEMAAYYATVTEVSDQVAKILQGGGTGNGTSDAKLKQAQELFDTGFSKASIQAVAGALHPLLGNRQREMIGDNRYLIKMFPEAAAPAGTASIATGSDGKEYYLDAKGQPIHVVGYGVR